MYDLKNYWFSRLDNKKEELELILESYDFYYGIEYHKQTNLVLPYYWIAYVPSKNCLYLYVESVSQELFENSGFQYVPTEYLLSL